MDDRIILVDDDPDYLDILTTRLTAAGFRNLRAEPDSLAAAAAVREEAPFDLALIDMSMPELDGIGLLQEIKTHTPTTECIMITAVNDVKVAVDCIRRGAYDYLLKPVSGEDLVLSVNRALERKRLRDILDIDKRRELPDLTHKEAFSAIATRSRNMLKVLKEAELHARSAVPILITGETGTGKELLARAVHAASPRADRPLTPVNMASLTASLFDAEFFGHTRGAFTGADRERAGHLEHAHGGTLFLDEIGVMPMELQGKLLRVLQSGEYLKLGTSTPRCTDVRLIAATNEDLEIQIDRKEFRKDLYYRLRGGWLHLPPLRERQADIPLLISTFLRDLSDEKRKYRPDVHAMTLLLRYDYPGNIRELKSVLESSVNLARNGLITVECLPEQIRRVADRPVVCPPCPPPADSTDPTCPLADVERDHILRAYRHLDRNKSQAARSLGIGLNTLRRRLAEYGED